MQLLSLLTCINGIRDIIVLGCAVTKINMNYVKETIIEIFHVGSEADWSFYRFPSYLYNTQYVLPLN